MGVNSYVCRSYKGKAGKGSFFPPPPSWIGLIINCNINFNKKEALAEMFSCEFFKIFENLLHRAPPEFRVQNTLLRVAINVRFYHVQEILIVQFVLKHTFLDFKWCLWFCAKGPYLFICDQPAQSLYLAIHVIPQVSKLPFNFYLPLRGRN